MNDWTKQDYDTLHSIVFALDADGRPRYPGYRPDVVESPNGDGHADREKRYAHVALKYLSKGTWRSDFSDYFALNNVLERAHAEALRVARALGVPAAFRPDIRYSTLRVLEYPPGATSARHTDCDLFTLLCYRDQPEGLQRFEQQCNRLAALDCVSPGLHIGELGEIIGLGPATPHEVVPVYHARCQHCLETQHSIVYFCLPSHDAVLPSGQTVGQWLAERMSRSRAPR